MRWFFWVLAMAAMMVPVAARELTEGEKIAYQAGFENGKREARIEALRAEQEGIGKQAVAMLERVPGSGDRVSTGTLLRQGSGGQAPQPGATVPQTTHTAQRASLPPTKKKPGVIGRMFGRK